MTPIDFDPAYSAGVRALIVETAAARPRRTHRRLWLGASVVVGLSALGAGGAIAASSVLPGADIVADTSASHTVSGVGPTVIEVGRAPAGTNALETSLTCVGSGTLTWPDGSSMSCSTTDADEAAGAATSSVPWSPGRRSFTLRATPGTRWRFTYTFSPHQPTGLETNAAGQSFGIDGDRHPDLVAATATNGLEGYIDPREAARLDASDPSHFRSPGQAVAWQRAHPNYAVDIPVYASDGTTRIGVFRIGG